MKKAKGSVTLEASVCVFVILFAVTSVYRICNIFSYYTVTQSALNSTALKLSADINPDDREEKTVQRYGSSGAELEKMKTYPDRDAIEYMVSNEYALAYGVHMYNDASVNQAAKDNIEYALFLSYFGNSIDEVNRNFNLDINKVKFKCDYKDGKITAELKYNYSLTPFLSEAAVLPIYQKSEVKKW